MNLEVHTSGEAGNDPVGILKGVQIFKTGTWRGSRTVDATPKMLKQIVDNFGTINQVDGYGVPVKIGHNDAVGAPAYGWMTNVTSNGDVLTADFADVPLPIIDAIGKRRYNSVSVELFPSITYGDKTFENVLGGVALLGAEWPAVKGLKPLSAASSFADAGDHLVLTMTEEPDVADETKFTQATTDALVLAAETRLKAEHATVLSAEQAKTTAAETRAKTAEDALAKFRDDQDQAKIDAVITAAEKDGKIVPANKVKIASFAAAVMKSTDPAARAELLSTFGELVTGLKGKVSFTEKGAGHVDDGVAQGQKTSDIIDEKAKSLMRADKTVKTYADAVKRVLADDDDLRHAYAAGE